MAATQNVPHVAVPGNFPKVTPLLPRQGVITLFGYGIRASVDRGHLVLEDGVGPKRRHARFARIGHNLRRLVVIGSDGLVSLSALRWLADQDAAFVMLNRDGSVLVTTGPVRPSDARLRRAQALAHDSGAALRIVSELIRKKLEAQEKLARVDLANDRSADIIARFRQAVTTAHTIESVRLSESRAAHAYWNSWKKVQINFPKRDLHRVPDHWRSFSARVSPLTRSPRLAANPVNAMLNYLYAVLESETRLAISALGLDPGLGFLHVDSPARDSLACDVMEPIRPLVDAYVLKWISRETLRREWFFEQRDGSCRLMGTFAVDLAKSAPIWRDAVAPVAEQVTRLLWTLGPKAKNQSKPPTRLTQDRRREARGIPTQLRRTSPPRPESFCRECGIEIVQGSTRCAECAVPLSTARLIHAAQQGRIAAHSKQAQKLRSETRRRHAAEQANWSPRNLPGWLTEDFYRRDIQPSLKGISLSALASTLTVSVQYASDLRRGRRLPHPRHWEPLAKLVRITHAP
jgi:CRISPR-associated protein Cas1